MSANDTEVEVRHSRRQLLAWAAALGMPVLAGVVGCEKKIKTESLTIAHAYQAAFGLLYIAHEAGFFQAEGLDITLKRFASGKDALDAVLKGQADVGTPLDTPLALAMLDHKPVRVLGTLALMVGHAATLARQDRGIRRVEDLRGKRVAFVPGSTGEYVLDQLLMQVGLSGESIVKKPMSPQQAVQAVLSGEVDAAAIWPPHTHQVYDGAGANVISTFISESYVQVSALVTSESVLASRYVALQRMLRALLKAQALATKEPERALGFVKAHLAEEPGDSVTRTWMALQPQLSLDNQLLASLHKQMNWFAKRKGVATVDMPDLRVFMADDMLRSLQPLSVTLPKNKG